MQGKTLPGRSAGEEVYVGIDVCKEWLDVYLHPIGLRMRVANTPEGIKRLKRWLADHPVVLVVMEATAKYHRVAQRMLHAAGFRVAVINPLRSRLFAEALGQLAKTDPIDARMLAVLAQSLSPQETPPVPALVEELHEIVRARQEATDELAAFKNRLGASTVSFVKREIARMIKNLENHIERLEMEVARRIESDPALARRYRILISIPGIGSVTAAVLLVGMTELGTLTGKAAALLAGLAPIAWDSGEKDGKRRIKGGRGYVRNALYMAGRSAARCIPHFKAFYERLTATKPEKVAITAVMRKLIVLANTLIKEDRLWQPVRP
jgi:transposase